MKIKPFVKVEDQMSTLGLHQWSVSRLIELSKNLPRMKVPIDHLNVHYKYEYLTLRDMATHMLAVQDADLTFPIILDEDGEVMDGRHRIIKALIEKQDTILVVRFDENPPPCRIKDE